MATVDRQSDDVTTYLRRAIGPSREITIYVQYQGIGKNEPTLNEL